MLSNAVVGGGHGDQRVLRRDLVVVLAKCHLTERSRKVVVGGTRGKRALGNGRGNAVQNAHSNAGAGGRTEDEIAARTNVSARQSDGAGNVRGRKRPRSFGR